MGKNRGDFRLRKEISKKRYTLSAVSTFLILFLVWFLLCKSGNITEIFLPSPSAVILDIINCMKDGSLWMNMGYSIFRITMGFLMSLLLGVPLGILAGSFKPVEDISYPVALGIGLFQVLSIVPGTSRSGSTIIGALLLGVSRVAAAEFTFFMAVPVMFGLSFLKLLKYGFHFTGGELGILLLGMVVAFLVSLAVIRFLMSYIRKHDFKAFGWYRIVLGLVLLIYFLVLK